MRSVLRSAKPYWIYLIITGKKTIEVGKGSPKAKDWNKIVEMYCSKDVRSFNRIPESDRDWMRKYLGKVACRFVCHKIDLYEYTDHGYGWSISEEDFNATCLTGSEFCKYGKGKTLYGIHITDLKIYDTPKDLGEFKRPCDRFLDCLTCGRRIRDEYGGCDRIITRAPQSFCYVEEI